MLPQCRSNPTKTLLCAPLSHRRTFRSDEKESVFFDHRRFFSQPLQRKAPGLLDWERQVVHKDVLSLDEMLRDTVLAASGKPFDFSRAYPLMDKELLQASIDAMRDEQQHSPRWDAVYDAQ